MPTFTDPRADAQEAYQALRGLAQATRSVGDPADLGPVLDDLQAGMGFLREVFDHLASVHVDYDDQAFDSAGRHLAGAREVVATVRALNEARTWLERVRERVEAASAHAGRIAWRVPGPAPAVHGRWVGVVFLQGEEADPLLDVIDREGPDAAIDHLAAYDVGEETTQAALDDGDVYDQLPAGSLDRMATKGAYTLTYNPNLGYLSLLRAYPVPPDPTLQDPPPVPAQPSQPSRPARRRLPPAEPEWFQPASRPPAPGRRLSL